MYRAQLACSGVAESEGHEGALDIAHEFSEHRPHFENVRCTYESGVLSLSAEIDFDSDGRALMDEFSDCIAAYLASPFDGSIRIVEVCE